MIFSHDFVMNFLREEPDVFEWVGGLCVLGDVLL